MSRWAARAVVLLVAVAFTLAGAPAGTPAGPDPASASHLWPVNKNVPVEQNNGVKVSAPNTSSMYCIVDDFGIDPDVRACWQPSGDFWYVADIRADGRSAGAVWEDAYPGGDFLRRQGICRNPYGYGTWAMCNKDYVEADTIYFAPSQLDGFHVLDDDLWSVCPEQWPCHII